jgi:hypothetical protein
MLVVLFTINLSGDCVYSRRHAINVKAVEDVADICVSHRNALCWLAGASALLLLLAPAESDDFGRIYYDGKTDQLVVTMLYRGTNPNHHFTLRWGACQPNQSGGLLGVTVEVLDDQFDDQALKDYRTTKRFGLADLPCARPTSVTLRTAPRFFYTLTIPG